MLQPLVYLDVDLGSEVWLGPSFAADAVLSPDGARLVYQSRERLFTRRLDQPNAVELAGTEGANAPFFSPDGQWVAFFTAAGLKKISVQGGAAVALCNRSGFGASWGEDDNIIASIGGVLTRIPSTGGSPAPLTVLAPGEFSHRWPQVLPGGKAVLFTAYTSQSAIDEGAIEVLLLPDGHRKMLRRGGTYGRYLPSGHLVYVNHGTLFAAPFDLGRLEVRGASAPVLPDVWYYGKTTGAAQFDFSGCGLRVRDVRLPQRCSQKRPYEPPMAGRHGQASTSPAAAWGL